MKTNDADAAQRTLDQWQDRQTVSGNFFLCLCAASFVALVLFCLDPCPGTVWLLLFSLTVMVYAGASMFHSAHAVVRYRKSVDLPGAATLPTESRVLPASAFYNLDMPGADEAGRTGPWIAFPKRRVEPGEN